MGDKVRIKVISANLARRQLDYEWVLTSEVKKERKNKIATPKNKDDKR
jgi:ribonuclease R